MGDEVFPRGQIALLNGDLFGVTNVKISTTNNKKQVHTIRRPGAGITKGVEETTVTYDAVIGAEGEERDYFTLVKNNKIVRLRIKIPGRTDTIEGGYQAEDLELPLDDAIKQSLTFIGHKTS